MKRKFTAISTPNTKLVVELQSKALSIIDEILGDIPRTPYRSVSIKASHNGILVHGTHDGSPVNDAMIDVTIDGRILCRPREGEVAHHVFTHHSTGIFPLHDSYESRKVIEEILKTSALGDITTSYMRDLLGPGPNYFGVLVDKGTLLIGDISDDTPAIMKDLKRDLDNLGIDSASIKTERLGIKAYIVHFGDMDSPIEVERCTQLKVDMTDGEILFHDSTLATLSNNGEGFTVGGSDAEVKKAVFLSQHLGNVTGTTPRFYQLLSKFISSRA